MSEHGSATGGRPAATTDQDRERAIGADGSVVNGDGGFDRMNGSDGTGAADRTREVGEDDLAERVDAIERAITGDAAATDLSDRAAMDARITDLEAAIETMDRRIEDLDAATQAVRGYVGGVRAVNREVERRADLALAKASRLEGDQPATGRKADRDHDAPTDADAGAVDVGPTVDNADDDDSAGYGPADHDRIRSDGAIPDGNGDGEAPWGRDDDAGTDDGRNESTTGPSRSATRRADGGAPRTDRPPAAAAAVPDADEIGRIPDAATDHADSATDRPDAGVLAKLRDVL
ncbi:DUF7310 family coiled-coil domain-containing protein [Halopenitus persicus]|uniref:DUF7310 domain-containing protein n=1 Tax=Halopenitus persicus TaxID=1048396 RepID=A0A1H3G864_9EURY|nr:hypothetical protein [Halopenitus persicus]SDX98559.1 hypothetical protein SAMN05216564_102347 [Halopenitus persicus]